MDAFSLAALAAVFLLLTALSAHRYQSLLAPAPLWNACWAILFAATAVLGYGFHYSAGNVLTLAVLAMLYNVPGFLLNSSVQRVPERVPSVAAVVPPFWLLMVAALIGFVGAVQLSVSLGTSILSLRSFEQLLSLGQENAIAIFRGEASFSLLTNITFAALQFSAALVGVRIALRPDWKTLVAVATLAVVASLWSSITTQRSYLLVPLVWACAGYVAALVWLGRRTVPFRGVLGAAGVGALALFMVVFLRAVRTGGSAAAFSEATFAPTRLWLAGYIPTFSAWLEENPATAPSTVLLNGVVALIDPLLPGADVEEPGGGYYYVGSGMTSNAATSMVSIISTGGVVWGAVMLLLLGTVAHLVYRRAAQGGVVAMAGYVGVVAATLWATNAWYFGYGGRVLALILLIVWAAVAVRRANMPEEISRKRGKKPNAERYSRRIRERLVQH